ncbi:MAG: dephospho-CoA kinase [Paludibacteraceae bacterium]|nr:dephospho-CoA kinase [Paludibacteraceae bacterium]
MLVGLTGGIGSGKSTIAAALVKRGYAVYDTDREAKRIIVHNPAVRSQVETLFGSEVFDGDTYLTQRVAQQVFADSTLLQRLNAIVHPAVRFDLEHWAKEKKLCFVESAILCESGLQELCQKVVYIDAPEELRLARTVSRDGSTPEQVRARIQAQKNDARQLADIVLNNDGSSTIDQLVTELISQL